MAVQISLLTSSSVSVVFWPRLSGGLRLHPHHGRFGHHAKMIAPAADAHIVDLIQRAAVWGSPCCFVDLLVLEESVTNADPITIAKQREPYAVVICQIS